MNRHKGFTLLTAIVVTSMLLLVSFVVADVTLKELVLAYSGQESQYAFYNADSGLECAQYWDVKATPGTSAFATSTTGTITCAGQTITTNSENGANAVPPHDTVTIASNSLIGGGGDTYPMSTFVLNPLAHGCVIVDVTKNDDGTTLIQSYGYNTCDLNSDQRFERGIKIQY